MSNKFDVVVIGGGPGGYVAAIRAAQLGFKTACIEKRGTLGGTCLNVGCIPSKALLESSEKYFEMKNHGNLHGIEFKDLKINLDAMMDRKNKTIDGLSKGIEGLFKKNNVSYFKGSASFETHNKILIKNGGSTEFIEADSIIIATGSSVMNIPNVVIDEEKILSSTGALSIKSVPKKLIVIGGGYIGLELGSVWSRLGSEVTIVEYLDRIVPAMDNEIAKQLHKILEKQGLKFKLSTKLTEAKATKKGVDVKLESLIDNNIEQLEVDAVLVAVGRVPYTENLGLDKIGVKLDDKSRIIIDNKFKTNIPNIYAIGDVVAGPMLAHKAEEEGVAVAEIIAGQAGHVNYDLIPGVIYTWPEVATIGKTEEQVKSESIPYKVGKFPFMANSRARASGENDGMVKIIARSDNDEVIGVHIIGPHAGTIIAEAVIAMEYKASSEDIARTCHAHPTLNEAVKEASMDVLGRAIHK